MFALRLFLAVTALSLVAADTHGSGSQAIGHRQLHSRAIRRSRRTCKPDAHGNDTHTSVIASAVTSATTVSQNLAHHASSSASVVSHPTSSPVALPNPPAGEFGALAPVTYLEAWSTSPSAPKPLPLSDATFRPNSVLKALSHPYVNAPDGQLSMQATYPEGSYNFQHQPLGGISFYAPGPASLDLTTAKEITLGYTVYFEEGFEFNIGGKLPGVCE